MAVSKHPSLDTLIDEIEDNSFRVNIRQNEAGDGCRLIWTIEVTTEDGILLVSVSHPYFSVALQMLELAATAESGGLNL